MSNLDTTTHEQVPLMNTEDWLYEDFEAGQKVRSIWCTISEGESMQFNTLVLGMHPYVADQTFAENPFIFSRRLVAEDDLLSCQRPALIEDRRDQIAILCVDRDKCVGR